jgi:hypothetical protein
MVAENRCFIWCASSRNPVAPTDRSVAILRTAAASVLLAAVLLTQARLVLLVQPLELDDELVDPCRQLSPLVVSHERLRRCPGVSP